MAHLLRNCLLIVDDDRDVREPLAELLPEKPYFEGIEIIQVADFENAMKEIRQRADQILLIISDGNLTPSGMEGDKITSEAIAVGIPHVVLLSGNADKFPDKPGVIKLLKPLDLDVLDRVVVPIRQQWQMAA